MKAHGLISIILCLLVCSLSPKVVLSASEIEPLSQCAKTAGSLVSVEGRVERKGADTAGWEPVDVNTIYCQGDSLRVLRNSRAALLLENDTVLRLDQNTTITLPVPKDEKPFLIRILQGVLYYFSIKPQSLELETPFVNGAVEGTEFIASVSGDTCQLSVFEGRVLLTNSAGTALINSGETTVAGKNQLPRATPIVGGVNYLQWALYYPPLIDLHQYLLSNQQLDEIEKTIGKAVRYFFNNDLPAGLRLLEVKSSVKNIDFYKVRASLYLTVGRVAEAERDIATLGTLLPNDSAASAFQAIIALSKGDIEQCGVQAQKALSLDPTSSAGLVAMSYFQQASFGLEDAKKSIESALKHNPDNGLLLARYADLIQSIDYTSGSAVEAAERASKKAPYLSHPHTILGFAFLNQLEIKRAAQSFTTAILLDQAAPLPRLGLGLVEIYRGNMASGRDLLSIAAVLDPGNSLVRSYLGKAYYEEKDYVRAERQFQFAKDLDPRDPTPFFYSAILKNKENQPGTALLELKKSMELNDNRAIFRSRLMLDRDLAARSTDTGRVFSQLGFDQLALNYGRKTLETAPADYSSHRLLADSYASMPRHEIARVSELLQAQLLQPENIGPIQPQLAEAKLQILDGSGPADPSFDEYNTLFNRNRIGLLANGVAGGSDTLGNDLVASGNYDKFSFSLGQFYYSTDGYRENNDQEHQLYNGYMQYRLTPSTHIMAELRSSNKEYGDLSMLFDPTLYTTEQRQETDMQSWRIGGRHAFSTKSEIIATFVAQQADDNIDVNYTFGTLSIDEQIDSVNGEIQHLYSGNIFRSIIGGSYYSGDWFQSIQFNGIPLADPAEADIDHTTLYGYGYIPLSPTATLTAGLNYTQVDDGRNRKQNSKTSPKIGLLWQPLPTTSFRMAWTQGYMRSLRAEQTIEPTQVAGFNQFYEDALGSESEIYGLGIDHEFSHSLYAGVSYMHRNLEEVPYLDPISSLIKFDNWQERIANAYLYWLPRKSLSLAMEYLYEKFNHNDWQGPGFFKELTTHRGKIKLTWFHTSGLRAEISPTYVVQNGIFVDGSLPALPTYEDNDSFWTTDASIGYLLPKGYGLISLQVNNLFDTTFQFQDTDPANPTISPGQLILLRFSCNF